jgi:hypothetical protein
MAKIIGGKKIWSQFFFEQAKIDLVPIKESINELND